MLGNFTYCNPTKLHFGENSLEMLKDELSHYGKNILLTYGGGSIKKTGLYDEIVKILKDCEKNITELPGVMPNPTVEKLYEGAKLARESEADLILAVGGGSVCDYSKAVSVSAYCNEDPWEKYYLKMEDVDNKIIPVGCVLTMVGTGAYLYSSEISDGCRLFRYYESYYGAIFFGHRRQYLGLSYGRAYEITYSQL